MEPDALNIELDNYNLEIVIGLETHIRLNTHTKLFCSCPNKEEDKPNENILRNTGYFNHFGLTTRFSFYGVPPQESLWDFLIKI